MKKGKVQTQPAGGIKKSATGIKGLDEITFGGLPTGRPTLVCGGAGAGKTMLAAEFLLRGATEFGEPGVFLLFEENAGEMAANIRSIGFDVDKLVASKKLVMDYVHIERSEIEETGEYDLEGLFIRLAYAIETIGAKRVVLDTLEALFAGIPDHAILRAELRRLFRWLKDRGMTAIVTGERGESSLTRFGLEEYVADCVILLDNRVEHEVSTRRLRIVKYRGSAHGTNEYPFLIGSNGLSVMPVTSLRLDHSAPKTRVSTGIERLDEMLGGKGVYRGSSVLITGSPGTGKSSIGASFVDAACRRGERAVLFAYEESVDQLLRNMGSIGMDLKKYIRKGLLTIQASRPTLQGLEQHLVSMHDVIVDFDPALVLVDPISNLSVGDVKEELRPTLMRLIDMMKQREITAVFTSLTADGTSVEDSQVGVSSLMDTWLLLQNVETNGERNRTLFILKSRGMAHSNQVREFVISDHGIDLLDVYSGTDRVLTGTARVVQEQQERAAAEQRNRIHQQRLKELSMRKRALEAQIAAMQAEAERENDEIRYLIEQETRQERAAAESSESLSRLRGAEGRSRNNPN